MPKDGLSSKFMTNLYYISPIIAATLKEHFNNPHDIQEEVLKDLMATETFSKRIGFIALSDINFRVSNALHEAGHLVLYREITNLNYGYSKKILNSLSAEIKVIGNSSARIYSYEPNILFTKQEILLRMKMLIAGQIASKIFLGDNYSYNYLLIGKNDEINNDIKKWFSYAKYNLKLNDKECRKLLIEQEKDVKLILHKNESLLLSLASKLYDDGFIGNNEIKKNLEKYHSN